MSGGNSILTGLILVVLFLALLVPWADDLGVLILGSIPLLLIVVGLVFTLIGATDLVAKKKEARASS